MLLASVPDWVPLLAPFAGVVTAAVGLVAAFKPWLAERKKKEAELGDHLSQGANALRLIFGVEEDKGRGVLPQQGILDRLDDLAKAQAETQQEVTDLAGQVRKIRRREDAE